MSRTRRCPGFWEPVGTLVVIALLISACDSNSASRSAPSDSDAIVAPARPAQLAPSEPSANALNKLIAATPAAPDGPHNDDLIGKDSGIRPPAHDVRPRRPTVDFVEPPHVSMVAGRLELRPTISTPAVERLARAQMYYPLRTCVLRNPTTKSAIPPPPESILIQLLIREDGTIEPTSVHVEPNPSQLGRLPSGITVEGLHAVSECVLGVLSGLPVHGPVAMHGTTTRLNITWPSVD